MTYAIENVVPLCVQVHAFISRNRWPPEVKQEYEQAKATWEKAPKGNKLEVFDAVMDKIHALVQPTG